MGTSYGNRAAMSTCSKNRMTGSDYGNRTAICTRLYDKHWLGEQEYEDSGYGNRIVMGIG